MLVLTDNEDYSFALEPYENFYFIHQTVRNWTPSVLKETRQIIANLTKEGVDLRVFIAEDNNKLKRYAGLYGFVHHYNEISPHDGQNYGIYTLAQH